MDDPDERPEERVADLDPELREPPEERVADLEPELREPPEERVADLEPELRELPEERVADLEPELRELPDERVAELELRERLLRLTLPAGLVALLFRLREELRTPLLSAGAFDRLRLVLEGTNTRSSQRPLP